MGNLGGLALGVDEVRGAGHDGVGRLLHILKHEGPYLEGGVPLAIGVLDPGGAVHVLGDAMLDVLGIEAATDEALESLSGGCTGNTAHHVCLFFLLLKCGNLGGHKNASAQRTERSTLSDKTHKREQDLDTRLTTWL